MLIVHIFFFKRDPYEKTDNSVLSQHLKMLRYLCITVTIINNTAVRSTEDVNINEKYGR